MGGGDLNLKKSWHPQTLRNVEKVWKAEQKAEAEAKKIEQLRRELDEEREREEMQRYAVDQGMAKKKSDRLEWMYSAPGHAGVNHEEYLLGKSIDKAVDPLAINDEKNAEAPGASFMVDNGPSSTSDLAAKIRDDPLFMIKKKENEKKKELLKNPVRMKQLQQMLKADLQSKERKKGKKEKKKRKKEKRKKSHDTKNYSLDESESKNDRYRKISSHNGKRRANESESSEDNGKQVNGSSDHQHHLNRNHSSKTLAQYKDKHSRHDNVDKRHKNHRSAFSSSGKDENLLERKVHSSRHHSHNSRQKYNRHSGSSSRSLSPSSMKQHSGNFANNHSKDHSSHRSRHHHANHSSSRRQHCSRSRSPLTSSQTFSRENIQPKSPTFTSRKEKRESGGASKMTTEERERKLAEMMANAKWRDEQRGKNVKKYKEEEEEEAQEIAKHKETGATFVQPMKVQTYTSSTASVENRIKRNIHSLQRTPASLENFLKK